MSDILVIPDSHCKPGVGNTRFAWLGKLISHRKPEYVVHLGDLWDMESLSSYDAKTIHAEGKRYRLDLEAGWDALDTLNDNIRGHRPKKRYCIGNHENRINKAVAQAPNLEGLMSFSDLSLKKFGWEQTPFLEALEINGVLFSHYFVSGVMARPIGGDNLAASMIRKVMKSSIAGHIHTLDYAERTDGSGRKIQSLSAGCFLEPGQFERYAGPANAIWRNCVCYLHDVKDGSFDLEIISIDRLKKDYGG